jgi:chromosome transmission fidelity protein 4
MLVAASGDTVDGVAPSWEWAPVLDTVGLRKSKDDSHWPVTVYDGKLICIPLKGGIKYPDAARRPVTTTLGLRMPLAKSVIQKKYVFCFGTICFVNGARVRLNHFSHP